MTISVNCIWSTEIVNGALFVCVGGFGNVVEAWVSGVIASEFPFGWPQPLNTSAISTVPQHNLRILTSELTGRDGFVMINTLSGSTWGFAAAAFVNGQTLA